MYCIGFSDAKNKKLRKKYIRKLNICLRHRQKPSLLMMMMMPDENICRAPKNILKTKQQNGVYATYRKWLYRLWRQFARELNRESNRESHRESQRESQKKSNRESKRVKENQRESQTESQRESKRVKFSWRLRMKNPCMKE